MREIFRRGTAVATVAALALAANAGAAAPATYYSGTTSQTQANAPTKFGTAVLPATKHRPRELAEVIYTADYSGAKGVCAQHFDGSLTRIYPKVRIDAAGHFRVKATDNGSPDDVVHDLQGRIVHHDLTGSFTESFKTYDPQIKKDIHCTSGKVTFTARRASSLPIT